MQVSQLNLDQLDYWVARAANIAVSYSEEGELVYIANPKLPPRKWTPTRFWSQGGPLIEAKKIDVNWDTEGTGHWSASCEPDILATGDTPLEAAMRTFVIAKFGNEVDQG